MSGTVLIYDNQMENIQFLYTPENVAHLHEVYIGGVDEGADELEELVYDENGDIQLTVITREEAMEYVINGADLILCGIL